MTDLQKTTLEYGSKIWDLECIKTKLFKSPKLSEFILPGEEAELNMILDIIKERIDNHYDKYINITNHV